MKIIITRHGQINNNAKNNLNKTGTIQIEKLSERLQSYKIDKIVSSNVKRCVDTTNIINNTLGAEIIYDDLIKERNNGEFAKYKILPWDELKGSFINKKPPSGESLFMVRKRVREFRRKLKTNYYKKNSIILIVSHGGFLKNFMGNLLGMNIKDSITKLRIDNASFSEVSLDNDMFRIITLNDTSHLR